MFEENPPSMYLTGSNHTEDSQETNTATGGALEAQENTGPIPGDTNNSHPPASEQPASPSSPQQHLACLRTLMSRQKAEYESRVASLEKRNRELQSEIKDMHSKLGQQRKQHSLVEMKMRNAERAKEDAERRNEMLQKEMEEFFETFGEINKWK
ncbi:rho GTPase-activating protein 24-like [Oxyura jamaicensis]|uniref:rho GTPase-activating protein 24-like n=1 Tax=Oxyura jamaicensis TaxID=8884 RepID=UPI0015A59466|nr:rho GTPase-activating protein 24-like [Oxyura jamaicensis]XP_035194233.1 rho GTPase-activating protein 24-like [Oxyura jamaicensis]